MAPAVSVRGVIRLTLACLVLAVAVSSESQQNSRHNKDRQSTSVREVSPNLDTMTERLPREMDDADTTLNTFSSTTTTENSATSVSTTTAFKPPRHENTSRAHRKAMRQARKGKSRKKRRGCKCVGRYMQDVEKKIDAKLKEFKELYVIPKLKDNSASRMNDNFLRLSGMIDETKKGLMKLSESVEGLLTDFQIRERGLDSTNKNLYRLSQVVVNLTKHVDDMERRFSSPGVKASRLRTRHPHGRVGDQRPVLEAPTPTKPPPTQCHEVYLSGSMPYLDEYSVMIQPRGVAHAFKAKCKVVDGAGWTVIQKRQDGSVDFYRNWDDYRVGFGSLDGEFWLGNDNIHYLTSQEDTMIRIEMEDWNGKTFLATYNHFQVAGASDNFRLHISGYNGTAGDSMTSLWESHDGMPFSTKDKDNDGRYVESRLHGSPDYRYYDSCAQQYQGAWWFNNCFEAHLNGKYYTKGFHKNYFQRDGIQWNTIHMYSSLKAVQMMIKPAEQPGADK
ncbi:hypothetical protein EGW08_001568 [Elysia chlorotica]|uniref:Fibrinogen C-terminal domain-containing protein n=1 Tax=Elysia chlorotica TaxID=188477 RepID=A0A433UA32_ELYCH|nr:hypothetical protein EGW08_001568 [Elysia chlorotica]